LHRQDTESVGQERNIRLLLARTEEKWSYVPNAQPLVDECKQLYFCQLLVALTSVAPPVGSSNTLEKPAR
jgi:hypothetical protein